MAETQRVSLEIGAPAQIPRDHDEDGGTLGDKAKKQIASRNWTMVLTVGAVLSGLCLIATGIASIFPSLSVETLNPGHYITCGYLVVFGALLILVMIPYPQTWKRLTLKWVPFLHTFRGRGLYMIFMGGLSTGLGLIGLILGLLVIVVGVAHFILACWFRNTLDPSTDFEKMAEERHLGSQITTDELKQDFAQEAQKKAWENRDTIAEAAWENRDSLAKLGTFVV